MTSSIARGIDHVGLTVPDIEEATQFFLEGFGAVVLYDTYRRNQPPRGDGEVHRRLGIPGTMSQRAVRMLALPNGPGVELFEYQGSDQAGPARPSDLGWQHVAFYVDDLDTAIERLEAVGAIANSSPHELAGPEAGIGNRFVYVRTPWGATVELISYPSQQPYLAKAPRPKWQV